MSEKSIGESVKSTPSFSSAEITSIAWRFAVVIALPLLLLIFVGRWLDSRAGSKYLYTLIGMLSAMIITTTILARYIQKIRIRLAKPKL